MWLAIMAAARPNKAAPVPQNAEDVRPSAFDAQKGKGRVKGVLNKNTTLLKDALIQAAVEAGGPDGLVGYLRTQATENPQSFLTLLGKVLPLQVTGAEGGPLAITRIEIVGVEP